jgi:hypothetical protein
MRYVTTLTIDDLSCAHMRHHEPPGFTIVRSIKILRCSQSVYFTKSPMAALHMYTAPGSSRLPLGRSAGDAERASRVLSATVIFQDGVSLDTWIVASRGMRQFSHGRRSWCSTVLFKLSLEQFKYYSELGRSGRTRRLRLVKSIGRKVNVHVVIGNMKHSFLLSA